MIFSDKNNTGRFPDAFHEAFLGDEQHYVEQCLKEAELTPKAKKAIEETARKLITNIREQRVKKSSIDAFMHEYDLTSEEGIALMCLAEAMLRTPDADTVDELIRDKLSSAQWGEKPSKTDSYFVNASTWALMLTGKIMRPSGKSLSGVLMRLVQKTGEPVIRAAVGQAMKILGKQFVMGRTIEEALKRAVDFEKKGYSYSYDMLGEAARTAADAEKYFESYLMAIEKIGQSAVGKSLHKAPGISVKLSALHPRYEYAKREQVLLELTPKLLKLAQRAKKWGISLTVDAEEARVLTISLEVFERVYEDASLEGWEGFGLAVQAYQKRAPYVLDWLIDLYGKHQRRIMVRLIKGAYWDAEIKYAQVNGLEGYPVFTRKASTDVSYTACMRKILKNTQAIYPMFGSHNAYTVATVLAMTSDHNDFEFQCLHGMGHALYDRIVEEYGQSCRIYAPVGGHRELLAYLVRRLLENGANTSFVNRIADSKAPIDDLLQDPAAYLQTKTSYPHPKIPLPRHLYGEKRVNSFGYNLSDPAVLSSLANAMEKATRSDLHAKPIVGGQSKSGESLPIFSPTDHREQVGVAIEADEKLMERALALSVTGQVEWNKTPVEARAAVLRRAADLMEAHAPALMAILTKEAGKTLPDGVAEVREAVDFCRYYADQAEQHFQVLTLPGPTGELNQLSLHGRGVIACISPWNFPLAIFMGQIVAALVTGNAVIAKPAEQTPAIAHYAVKLLLEAGVPADVLHLLPGDGERIGAKLINDLRIAGVMFTGSTQTARMINQALAVREGPIVPLIAETGGQNCMIVDSTALLEQVAVDVLSSAFGSAGQRCSALRVLYVQEDIADSCIEMIKGAMATLEVGDPALLKTDVGPVIDDAAYQVLNEHFHEMQNTAKLIYQVKLPTTTRHGTFFAPCVFEIDHINQLKQEFFGPFLHIIRFKASKLNQVLADIASTGFGLTQGLHSRISDRVNLLKSQLHVGNFYVNRNMIGAVVGVQPFGGDGLSGTGPKAGGPHYLLRLVTERTLSIDTTASGGNASLLMLTEDE